MWVRSLPCPGAASGWQVANSFHVEPLVERSRVLWLSLGHKCDCAEGTAVGWSGSTAP